LGLFSSDIPAAEKAYDEKREEVIAYQKKQKRRGFRFFHANDLIRFSKLVKPKQHAGFVHVQGLGPACSNFGNVVVTNLIQVCDRQSSNCR
jgi:hypothetical protein